MANPDLPGTPALAAVVALTQIYNPMENVLDFPRYYRSQEDYNDQDSFGVEVSAMGIDDSGVIWLLDHDAQTWFELVPIRRQYRP